MRREKNQWFKVFSFSFYIFCLTLIHTLHACPLSCIKRRRESNSLTNTKTDLPNTRMEVTLLYFPFDFKEIME